MGSSGTPEHSNATPKTVRPILGSGDAKGSIGGEQVDRRPVKISPCGEIAAEIIRIKIGLDHQAGGQPADMRFQRGHRPVAVMAGDTVGGGIQMAMVGNTAIHPLSYPLTIDHGVRHGFACALFLPEFLRFNAPALHAGFADLFAVLGLKSVADLADDITLKMEKLGAPTRLGPLGVATDDLADIARRGVGRSTEWNPRMVHPDDIIAICQRML